MASTAAAGIPPVPMHAAAMSQAHVQPMDAATQQQLIANAAAAAHMMQQQQVLIYSITYYYIILYLLVIVVVDESINEHKCTDASTTNAHAYCCSGWPGAGSSTKLNSIHSFIHSFV